MSATIVFGPSLAETSWEDARDRVREALWRRSSSALPDALVDDAIHTALLGIEAERRWLWLENVTGAVEMALASDNLALPGSVKSISSLAYLSGTQSYDILLQRPLPFVRQLSRGSNEGAPTFYAISDKQLYFDCKVPDGSQFELVFTSSCPRFVEEAILTPPVTLTMQRPAVIALAAEHLALTFLKNGDEAARQRAAYDRLLERLFNEEDQARVDTLDGGSIQPDDSFHRAAFGE
jgi:hypothetical protein